MKDFTKEMIGIFSSETRCKILEMLWEGYDHPDDLAEELDLTRQAVDKHLVELHDWGMVERNAVFPPEGRPKIIYELTKAGKRLMNTLDNLAERYRETMLERAEEEIEQLDMKLASGELSEKIYKKKVKEIKERWNYSELKSGEV
ncbi:MAG: winged helix-turn-helix transcriptional regulator [Candidatus Thermoplasmatota archaeon]|nr:winged helix-turn-helix transcriptional regulator [Candidatus Thermoplasmatota archaeon]MBS3790746.1 winged helix-turn-helix transcriptional regulator [Candidatus Thermoplasmatota archaeon]